MEHLQSLQNMNPLSTQNDLEVRNDQIDRMLLGENKDKVDQADESKHTSSNQNLPLSSMHNPTSNNQSANSINYKDPGFAQKLVRNFNIKTQNSMVSDLYNKRSGSSKPVSQQSLSGGLIQLANSKSLQQNQNELMKKVEVEKTATERVEVMK